MGRASTTPDAFNAIAEPQRRQILTFLDEFSIAVSPVFLGAGLRLFDGVDEGIMLEIVEALHSPMVTHLSYAVGGR